MNVVNAYGIYRASERSLPAVERRGIYPVVTDQEGTVLIGVGQPLVKGGQGRTGEEIARPAMRAVSLVERIARWFA